MIFSRFPKQFIINLIQTGGTNITISFHHLLQHTLPSISFLHKTSETSETSILNGTETEKSLRPGQMGLRLFLVLDIERDRYRDWSQYWPLNNTKTKKV